MRQNEPNIYIGEKKMRSFGGYGQRSRSARAASGCGLASSGVPHTPRSNTRIETTENHVCATHDRDAHTPTTRARKQQHYSFFNLLYLLIFIIFSHFDILFFSWCAPQLTCCAWPGSICGRSCDRRLSILYWRARLVFVLVNCVYNTKK